MLRARRPYSRWKDFFSFHESLGIELIVVEAEVALLDLTIVSNRAELSDGDIAEVVARAVSAHWLKPAGRWSYPGSSGPCYPAR